MYILHPQRSALATARGCHARPLIRTSRLPPAFAGRSENVTGNNRRSRRTSASKNPSGLNEVPNPAEQLANNISAVPPHPADASTPSPAVQLADSIADQPAADSNPTTAPGADHPEYRRPQKPQYSGSVPTSASTDGSRDQGSRTSPADVVNQSIQAAAGTAEDAITQTAAAAVAGISGAANLTTQGISAAERAAEDTARNLADAAETAVTAAASAVGGAAGAVDGTISSFTSNRTNSRSSTSNRGRDNGMGSGQSGTTTGSFDSVNVRVPANMAWANATPARGTMRDVTKTQDFDEDEVEDIKVQILAAVASLDRGLAANLRESREVDSLCRRLEDVAGPVTLKWATSRSSPDQSTMDKLAGTWRLIYSSGFNGGSLGGSRPGPPAALVPTILGQVYQVIDADKLRLDNVVELLLNYGVPTLPFLPKPDPQPTPGVRLSLQHTYDITQPNTVTVVFESTTAKTIGPDLLQNLPQIGVPELPDFLKPPKNFRSASFDVTYLDASMRITRGDRGELRVYLRDKPLNTMAPADYVD